MAVIVDLLLGWLIDLIDWLVDLFPDSDSFINFDGWTGFTTHLGDLNYFLPISEVFVAVLAAFYLFPVLVGTTLTVWVIALIRGGSGRG